MPHPCSTAPADTFGEAGQLARALIAYAPRKIPLVLLLLLATAVTEAFGFLMLIPLLHVIGLSTRPGAASPVAEAVARTADAAGIELTLPAVLAMFMLIAAVRSVVAWQRDVLLADVRIGFIGQLRERLFAAVAGVKWEYFVRRRQSDVQHVLTSDVHRIGTGLISMLQLTVAVMLVLAQIALAMLISLPVTAVVLATGSVLLFLTRPLMRRSRTLGEALTGGNRKIHHSVTDFLGGLKLAKSYNTEGMHVRHFTEAVSDAQQHTLAFARISAITRACLYMGATIVLVVMIWLAVPTNTLTIPELLLMVFIFARLLPVLFQLQQNAQLFMHQLPAYAHARAMHRELRRAAEAPPAGGGETRMMLRGALTMRNVSFVYEAGAGNGTGTGTGEGGARSGIAKPALKNVNLEVPAGSITVITGPSGAGKSTLADVLLGLIEPHGGEVLVDGNPLTGSNSRRWRCSVACVLQDPHLFHDTIRANLRWARPEATDAEIWQALRLAAAEEFVATLPAGLDTVVGDRGGRLSGGERQRIALAQALVREPALLVLDETTSQLDAENERRILAVLESLRGRTTVVVIAHRPALLQAADRIVLLESGRVSAAGIWRELADDLASQDAGAFRQLHPGRSPGGERDPVLEERRLPR